ncbi:MAG: glycosyltransferase family 39 protein [Candidatus Omnitrophica bacterium]|nr:glycosyltransferase family 39 protein [Candidatus Omnitrophota bacterium]
MEIIIISASLMAVTFIGWNALRLIGRGNRGLCIAEEAALSYILGIGLISMEMLLFYFFGIPLRPVFILAPWIVPIAVNVALRNLVIIFPARGDSSRPKAGIFRMLLMFGIAFETAYTFFRALIKPIESYDAVAIYAIKSKMFYMAGAITSDIFNAIKALYPHPDYPLNIPLAETFFYLCMGSLNDQIVKIIFPLFFVAVLVMIYFAVRRFASSTYALIFVFILASIPQFNAYAANAYHELPLACYYFASAVFLFRWFDNPGETWCLPLSALLVGLAGWTKNEGLLYCVVNMAVLGVFVGSNFRKIGNKSIIYAAVYPVIVLALLLPWVVVKKTYGFVNSDVSLSCLNPQYVLSQLNRFGPIFYEFQKQFFGPKKWNLIWPAAAVIIAFNYKKAFSGVGKYMALSIALAVSGYILFYLISYVDVVYFLSKTWARFLLHFLPLVVYWLAFILKDEVKV